MRQTDRVRDRDQTAFNIGPTLRWHAIKCFINSDRVGGNKTKQNKNKDLKMSCLSDVDLATLHKCRLDQRIKYELSGEGWVNRRSPVIKSRQIMRGSKSNEIRSGFAQVTKSSPRCDCCCESPDKEKCPAPVSVLPTDCADPCACQRSGEPVAVSCDPDCGGSAAVVKSDNAEVIDGAGDKRRVGKQSNGTNCKHAALRCANGIREQFDDSGRGDKESYLTRRRSGTWP